MRLSLLSELHCPYCGSGIELAFRLPDQKPNAINYGVLRCACNDYPVVQGIPILQHVDGLSSVVDLIRQGNGHRALLQAMNLFRVKWAHRSRWHQLRYYLNCQRLVTGRDLSFEDAVNLVRKPSVFSDYLLHRYANPSFLAAIGPLMLLDRLEQRRRSAFPGGVADGQDSHAPFNGRANSSTKTIRVLDLACGAGHTSFLMRHLFPELSVVSVDHDFVSLYLAKRFLAPDSIHLCLDAEVLSPFVDQHFDAVFCLDAFHYLHSKKAIVAELKRVSKPGALWLFPHLHNALQQNMVAGLPLSPDGYLECFSCASPRLFDETEILHGLSKKYQFDLSRNSSVSELNNSQTLTLIGGDEDLWRVHNRFPASFCEKRSSLVINPIYHNTPTENTVERTLRWPNEVMRRECRGAEAILPGSCHLSQTEIRQLTKGDSVPDGARLEKLVAKFVLVPLPPHYTHSDLPA
ncbi:MAG TPA: class I SAM-dependent methyltransferase [Terrimicrobiaceae bacterium]